MSPAPKQVTPEEIALSTQKWLQDRWATIWPLFPAAEEKFLRNNRRTKVGEDILANIALAALERVVERDERKVVSPAYLVTQMNWMLLRYFRDNEQPWQYNEVETEKGIVS